MSGVKNVFRVAVCFSVLASLLSAPARAQNELVILPELPFTSKLGVGARAAGMGFAYGAVAEDGASLFYNPAGLAQIRRIEVTGGLIHDSQDRQVDFDTETGGFPGTGTAGETVGISNTQIGHVSLAYPFPTYRGSLVMGVAFHRVASLESDYFRQGFILNPASGTDGLLETESFIEDGSVNYWTAGLAGDVSPRVSLGASVTYIHGDTRQDFQIGRLRADVDGNTDVNGSTDVFLLDEVRTADLTGYTGSLGALARASDMVRLGLTIDLPQHYEFSGFVTSRLEDQQKIDRSDFNFEDTITLPFSFTGSLAVTPRNFLLAADFRLTDWTQIDFEGDIRTRDRENAYRSTIDIGLGAEYQFPAYPTRLRAGFSSQPLPYQLQAADIDFTFVSDDNDPNTTDDASFFTRDFPSADITTDRYFVTFGAGTLVDNAVTLDVAYVHGIYKRAGGAISEEWTTDRIFGSATFRF